MQYLFLNFYIFFSTFSVSFRCELCQYCISCRFCIQKKSSFSKRFPNSFRFSKQTSLFSQRFSFISSNYSFSLRQRTDAPGITAPAFTINSTSALFGRSIWSTIACAAAFPIPDISCAYVVSFG